jgi:hypothetical protein
MMRYEGQITLGGYWNDDMGAALRDAFGDPEQDFVFIPQSHRLWRLEIYKERFAFRARINWDVATPDDISASVQPLEPVRRLRAEWWRLALWYLCAPVRWWTSRRNDYPVANGL